MLKPAESIEIQGSSEGKDQTPVVHSPEERLDSIFVVHFVHNAQKASGIVDFFRCHVACFRHVEWASEEACYGP